MRPIGPCLSALLLLFAGCGQLAREPLRLDQAGCAPMSADALLSRAEQYGPRSSTAELRCALENIRRSSDPALSASPLGSRVCLSLAERETDPAARAQLAAEGVRLAERVMAHGQGKSLPAAHYYLAANLGIAVRDQPTLAAENLPRIEREAQAAVSAAPELDQGGPLRLLGLLYLEAPPWPAGIGDGDKALDLLAQAVERFPEHPLNHLFYAQTLWEVEGQSAAARARAEFGRARQLLEQGDWGGARPAWQREFDKVGRLLGMGGS